MRRVFFGSVAVILTLGIIVPAAAQIAPGRSGSSSVYTMAQEEAINDLVVFGRCYARQETKRALQLLATDPSSRAEAETYRRLFQRDDQMCIAPGTTMSAPLPFIRGVIAEGFIGTGTPLPASHLLTAPAAAEVRNLGGAARCYVAGHRAEVQALLKTAPTSPEERATLEPLVEGFKGCLPPGVNLQFSPTVIRFRLAEALLRLPPAASVPTGS